MKNASTSISDTQPREEDAEPAQFFDKITLHALRRLAGFTAQRHKRRKRYGWWVVAYQNHRMGPIDLNGTIVPPRPTRRIRGS